MKKNVYLFSKPDLCTKLRSKHCTTALCYIIISKMKEMKRSVIRKFNRHNVGPWTDKKWCANYSHNICQVFYMFETTPRRTWDPYFFTTFFHLCSYNYYMDGGNFNQTDAHLAVHLFKSLTFKSRRWLM